MLIYFALLVVVALSVHLSHETGDRVARFLLYFVAFVSLVLVSGLRSSSVGTDAGYYARDFEHISGLSGVWGTGVEPGVPLLSWLGRLMYNDYSTLFTLAAIVVTLCFLLGIRQLSVNPAASTFVLLASGAFYFSFNGMRQGIAVGLLFLAIPFIYYRKFWAFLVCIAVASFFHVTAIAALPVYFLVPRQNDLKYDALIFGIALFSILFFSESVALAGRLNPRFLAYGEAASGGRGLVSAAFLGSLGIFFLYFKKYVQQYRSLYDLLLNLYLLGLAVTAISVVKATGGSGLMRLNGYFTVSQILLWPIVFVNIQGHRYRDAFLVIFTSIYLVYHALTLRTFSNMTPYSFNPVVHNWFPRWF